MRSVVTFNVQISQKQARGPCRVPICEECCWVVEPRQAILLPHHGPASEGILPVHFGDDNVRAQNPAGPLIQSHGTTMGSCSIWAMV